MRFACLIAACLMGTAPAFAAEEAVKLDFSVAVAGMKAIKLEYRANLTAQNYQADVGVDVKGIAEMFADLDLDLKASGAINGASLRPQAFEMKTTDEKQRRTTQVSWAPDGKPQGNRSFRLDDARAKAAEAALEPNMPDPLSALMAVALTPPETLCEGTLRTYNGTEVLDFAFRKLGTDTFLEENQGVYTGPATRCRLELKPVAGVTERRLRKWSKRPPVYTIWFATATAPSGRKLNLPIAAEGLAGSHEFKAWLSEASLGGKPLGQ